MAELIFALLLLLIASYVNALLDATILDLSPVRGLRVGTSSVKTDWRIRCALRCGSRLALAASG